MTEELRDALTKVFDYLEADELRNVSENPPANHIASSLQVIGRAMAA